MTKKCIISVLLVAAWAFFASLFYKTIMLMLLFLGMALIGSNIILLVWFNKLAKKTSNELISYPVSK